MPRIPEGWDNPRPVPKAELPIVRNRAAGMAGEAASELGGQVSKIAADLLERKDEAEYASAKANYLIEMEKAKSELQDDQDYGTFHERFAKRAEEAQKQSLGMMNSRARRSMFEAEASVMFAQNAGQVEKLRRGKEVSERKATLLEQVDLATDAAAKAADDQSVTELINTASSLVETARGRGDITPEEAFEIGQRSSASIALERFNALWGSGQFDKAEAWLNNSGQHMAASARQEAYNRVAGRGIQVENQSAVVEAFTRAAGGKPPEAGAAPPSSGYYNADVLRGRALPTTPGGNFGAPRNYGGHDGRDYPATPGTAIYSLGPGKVITSTRLSTVGGKVIIKHDDGRVSEYKHMGRLHVKDGQRVDANTQIGVVGTNAEAGTTSRGTHLHLTVRDRSGNKIDPATLASGNRPGVSEAASHPSGFETAEDARRASIAVAEERGIDDPLRLEEIGQQGAARWQRFEVEKNQSEAAAEERVWAETLAKGGVITDPTQVNLNGTSAKFQLEYAKFAKANLAASAGEDVETDPETNRRLDIWEIDKPERFVGLTPFELLSLRSSMSEKDYNGLLVRIAKKKKELDQVKATSAAWNPLTQAKTAVDNHKAMFYPTMTDTERLRVYNYTLLRIEQWRKENPGKVPNSNQIGEFVSEMTRGEVYNDYFAGIPTGQTTYRPTKDLPSKDHPVYKAIEMELKRRGKPNPNFNDVADYWRRMNNGAIQ